MSTSEKWGLERPYAESQGAPAPTRAARRGGVLGRARLPGGGRGPAKPRCQGRTGPPGRESSPRNRDDPCPVSLLP